jgi:RNase H-fold protein (predicted Holliday junction resolvase)
MFGSKYCKKFLKENSSVIVKVRFMDESPSVIAALSEVQEMAKEKECGAIMRSLDKDQYFGRFSRGGDRFYF